MSSFTQKVSFTKDEKCEFITTLRDRVNTYLKQNNLSSKANKAMIIKSVSFALIVATLLWFLYYFQASSGLVILTWSLLGFFLSTGTMNVVHDALHGAYLNSPSKNRTLGFLMDLIGVSSFYWKKEHTIDHHTFTNIQNHDADLDVPFILRLSPEAPRYAIHKYQHFYAPFLYCLNFFHWAYVSDIKRIWKIMRGKSKENPSKKEVFFLMSFKVIHILLFIVLPCTFLSTPIWVTLIGYLCYLFTASLTMTTIFQLAHIVEGVAFPSPTLDGKISNSFAKHQLATTADFAPKSPWVNYLFGGLNFQIEHHLFPHLCHIHLHKISPIVEKTAKEFGLTYHQNPTFFAAIKSHFKILRMLGKN